jgi:hypothetical protein
VGWNEGTRSLKKLLFSTSPGQSIIRERKE